MFQNLIADISKNFLHYLFNTLMCYWNILQWYYLLLPLWAKFAILVFDIKRHILKITKLELIREGKRP